MSLVKYSTTSGLRISSAKRIVTSPYTTYLSGALNGLCNPDFGHAAAERAKRQLSSATIAEIEVESLAEGHDLKTTLTRAKFESLNQAHFDNCLSTVKAVLKDSGIELQTQHNRIVEGKALGPGGVPSPKKVPRGVERYKAGLLKN